MRAVRALAMALLVAANAEAAPPLEAYKGGLLLVADYWTGGYTVAAGTTTALRRLEAGVQGEGRFAVDDVIVDCAGTLRCYGDIRYMRGKVEAPGNLTGDMIRADNGGASGYAIARKTAVRGNDGYGSWGHQINLSRAHAGIAIVGDATGDEDRTLIGVWISEHVAVEDAAIRYNVRPGATGWAIKMVLPDGRAYGLDAEGVLHVREVKIVN